MNIEATFESHGQRNLTHQSRKRMVNGHVVQHNQPEGE